MNLTKQIRKPTLQKARMSGNVETYKKLLHEVEQWNHLTDNSDSKLKTLVYGLEWNLSEMGFHGWDGEAAESEREGMKKICDICTYLEQMLKDLVGIEDECFKSELDENGYSKFKMWQSDLDQVKTEEYYRGSRDMVKMIRALLCVQDEDYDKPIISPKWLNDYLDQMVCDGKESEETE